MNEQDTHRRLREQLGSYVLGHLDEVEHAAVRAHLDGCASCRAELAEIEPLVEVLGLVDLDRLDEGAVSVTPPPLLGERIRAATAAERPLREAREAREAAREARGARGPVGASGRRLTRGRVAVTLLVVAAAVLIGGVVGRATAPQPPPVPLEAIELRPVEGSGLRVQDADLIPHTWGVEVQFVGTGFVDGETYRATVRSEDGSLRSAGAFLGTGDAETITCRMQAALLREDTTSFVVRDSDGRAVLRADLPTPA